METLRPPDDRRPPRRASARGFGLLGTAVSLSLLVGCAARPPADYLLQLGREHPSYPPATHKCALGQDSGSSEAALDRAIAGVVRLVQSSVQSELENVVEVLVQDEVVSDRETIRQRITRTSEFAHEELIHDVDSAEWDGSFRVYACLDRAEAAAVLWREAKPILRQHEEAVRLAQEASTPAEFAARYREVERFVPEVVRFAGTLSFLKKSSAAPLQASLAAGIKLYKKAQGFRSQSLLGIVLKDVAPERRRAVESTFRQGIEDLGLRSSVGGANCSGGDATHLLEVRADQTCTSGSVIFYCDLAFDLRLRSCTADGASSARIEGKAFRGTNNQFIEAKARDKSWGKLNAEGLAVPLRELVSAEIPLD